MDIKEYAKGRAIEGLAPANAHGFIKFEDKALAGEINLTALKGIIYCDFDLINKSSGIPITVDAKKGDVVYDIASPLQIDLSDGAFIAGGKEAKVSAAEAINLKCNGAILPKAMLGVAINLRNDKGKEVITVLWQLALTKVDIRLIPGTTDNYNIYYDLGVSNDMTIDPKSKSSKASKLTTTFRCVANRAR